MQLSFENQATPTFIRPLRIQLEVRWTVRFRFSEPSDSTGRPFLMSTMPDRPLSTNPIKSSVNSVHLYFQPFTPKELDIKEKADQRPFPWLPFLSIMLAQYALIFSIVWSDADFGLFLSLAGAVSGSTVVMIFPASFWLHIDGWKLMQSKTKFKNAFCYFSKFMKFLRTILFQAI